MEQNCKISTAFILRTWLIQALLFLLCIDIGVNGTVKCRSKDSTSGEETRQFCSDQNATLLYMTDGTKNAFLNYLHANNQSYDDKVSAWTKHHVKRPIFEEGNIYFSEFPFIDDVPFYEESIFCMYAIFYLKNDTVGWVPSDCSENFLNSVDCCFKPELKGKEAWNATLYAEEVTWNTADNYCSREGSNLINLTRPIEFHQTFAKTPWISSGVTKFWTSHYSSGKYLENSEITKLYNFAEGENNQTGCVYVIVESQYQSFPKLKLAIDKCNNAEYSFICMKPAEYKYFDSTPNIIRVCNYIMYDGQPYTIAECVAECWKMSESGYRCEGFDYNKSNSSCRFKETPYSSNYSFRYDPDWISVDFTYVHAMFGDYTPKHITGSTFLGGSPSKNDIKLKNKAEITSLSYLYNKNAQSTWSSEKTHISDSDKTSNYPAATNDIDLDATVLGKTFTAAASVVVVVASVVVLGSTFIKIMELMEKGSKSSATNSSHNGEDYVRLSNCKHEVTEQTSRNNFIIKPTDNFQLKRQQKKLHKKSVLTRK